MTDNLISKRSATERLIIAKTLLESVLQDMPTAEPKKGKWIINSPVTMKCDQCGYSIPDWKVHEARFCPDCGARMEGEDE